MPQDKHKSWHSRGYLPHFDQPGVVQFITFRLHDSLPMDLLKEWQATYKSESIEIHRKVERYLDEGVGSCHLKNPSIAILVEQALLHFDDQRYRLLAWVVMPNHVHVLIEEMRGYHLSDVVHSWKSYTSKQAGKFLANQKASSAKENSFWQRDSFDRFIRDQEHLGRVLEYIHNNPVKAELCERPGDFRFSSARLSLNSGG